MVCRPLCVALGSGGALVIRVPILLGPSAATGALDLPKDVVQRAGQAAPAAGQVNPRGRTASLGQPPAGPMVEPAGPTDTTVTTAVNAPGGDEVGGGGGPYAPRDAVDAKASPVVAPTTAPISDITDSIRNITLSS